MKDFTIGEINTLEDMKTLRQAWQDLFLQSDSTSPFQSWEWNYGMAKYESEITRLHIVVARGHNGDIIAIAPMWVKRKGFLGLKVLEFIGTDKSDYMDLLFVQQYQKPFVKELTRWIERNRSWHITHLRGLREEMAGLISQNGLFTLKQTESFPLIYLPDNIELYDKGIPRKLRQNIHSRLRKLGREREFRFAVSTEISDIKHDVELFMNLHQQRQTARGERGRFHNPEWRQSFVEIVLNLAKMGLVRIGVLRIDGEVAACRFNLRLRDREYCYLPGMDPKYTRYSPGSLMHYWMIGEAIKSKMRIYDFLRGSEHYKSWWTNGTCGIYQLSKARSRFFSLAWDISESFRNYVYTSSMVKQVYHAGNKVLNRKG